MPSLTVPLESPPPAPGGASSARLPISPNTPTMSHGSLTNGAQPGQAPSAQPPPPYQPTTAPSLPSGQQPVSISLDDNPDAIALRGALNILQIQREQSIKDLRELQALKQNAVKDPQTFARELKEGRVRSRGGDGLWGGITAAAGTRRRPSGAPSGDEMAVDAPEAAEGAVGDNDEDEEEEAAELPPYGAIPAPQNVVRCPPINWAKYHVVGESLDKLHREQQLRPATGELAKGERAPEHVIAAPYRPFVDKVEPRPPPMRTRSSGTKEP